MQASVWSRDSLSQPALSQPSHAADAQAKQPNLALACREAAHSGPWRAFVRFSRYPVEVELPWKSSCCGWTSLMMRL
jgi:hypothetical protein